jgi:hypothetical protein
MYKFTEENVTYIVERGDLQWGFAAKKDAEQFFRGEEKWGYADAPLKLKHVKPSRWDRRKLAYIPYEN